MSSAARVRVYRGCHMLLATGRERANGWRWTAFVDGHGSLYASTLADMRGLITDTLRKGA